MGIDGRAHRRLAITLVVAAATSLLAVQGAPGAAGAERGGTLYLVQGLPDTVVTMSIDGDEVASGVEGASLAGPFEVAAGAHTLAFTSNGDELLSRGLRVGEGDSTDVVLHLPVDPAGDPVVTTFDNTSEPVPADKAALVVTHTAAVPPADIRVDGEVLFSNVANGESLSLVVPAGTYAVDIVPTGQDDPVVLGPLDLTVTGGSLNRVFAVGDPESDDMRVVVQVLDLADAGSARPSMVDTGTGGQAVGYRPEPSAPWYAGLWR